MRTREDNTANQNCKQQHVQKQQMHSGIVILLLSKAAHF